MSERETDHAAHAFRRHFSERELERVDALMDTFLHQLIPRGLTSRKHERWLSVMNFRATQLSTVDSFGLSPREVEKIKKTYVHAFMKVEKETQKILREHGLQLAAEATRKTPVVIDKEKVALDAWAEIAHATGDSGSGYLFFWEEQAIRRVVATHVVLEAGVLDEATMQASDAIAAFDGTEREEAERRYDAELTRLVATYGLEQTVDEIVASLTTERIDEAAL
jgi:hypothetical protein